MKAITLEQVVNSQNVATNSSYTDTRFIGDYESNVEFVNSDYDELYLIDTDHSHDRGNNSDLYETVIAIKEDDSGIAFYKLVAKTTDFNGEPQVSYSRQELSLQGFNYFTKDVSDDTIDFEGIYNRYLKSKGYDFTIEDVHTLGEFLPEYNCTTLQFKDESDNKHYITINSHGQLSKITIKLSPRKVGKINTFKSAFGSAVVQANKA